VTPARVQALLDRAVRLAARGHGGAEPNPMVGCIIADTRGEVISEGFHRRCGGPHAEVNALTAAGARSRGATAIVTLEPCAHRGRTGPCTEALIAAGIARVLYAVADPNPLARGGSAQLLAAGIDAELVPHAGARELALPFMKRVTTGLPWVCAKWAQSIDGAIALANGDSKWLSCARSRHMVHRERGRVDAILTGIGTVVADDPQLTARSVRVQRSATRIVFDPAARTPPNARICAPDAPTIVLASGSLDPAGLQRAGQLAARGVRVMQLGPGDTLETPLRQLSTEGVARVLVEAGGGVVGRLLREKLLDEAWVFIAPFVVGDDMARRSVRGLAPAVLASVARARLMSARRRGADALLHYRWTA
jgi:diaminohydroxyphosphoribosylaminopyrimidine deaminase/5-amino-6-(5-phosphoribosylamino)uracil reductase